MTTKRKVDWKKIAEENERAANENRRMGLLWQERAWVGITALVLRAKRDLGTRATQKEINALVSLQIKAAEAVRGHS